VQHEDGVQVMISESRRAHMKIDEMESWTYPFTCARRGSV